MGDGADVLLRLVVRGHEGARGWGRVRGHRALQLPLQLDARHLVRRSGQTCTVWLDDLRDLLEEYRVDRPVLAIFGEHDVTATPADAIASLQQLNPRPRCVTVPGAGHWVQFERPAVVNHELIDWFA